jgi:hypothetical protein
MQVAMSQDIASLSNRSARSQQCSGGHLRVAQVQLLPTIVNGLKVKAKPMLEMHEIVDSLEESTSPFGFIPGE